MKKACIFPTEKSDGFDTPIKFREFVQLLEACIQMGLAKEVAVDPFHADGKTVGCRWFKDMTTDRIWRLVEPSGAFAGGWEQVYNA